MNRTWWILILIMYLAGFGAEWLDEKFSVFHSIPHLLLIFLFVVTNFTDWLTTRRFITKFGAEGEANPFLRLLYEKSIILGDFVKLFVLPLGLLTLYALFPYKSVLVMLTLMLLFLTVNNALRYRSETKNTCSPTE